MRSRVPSTIVIIASIVFADPSFHSDLQHPYGIVHLSAPFLISALSQPDKHVMTLLPRQFIQFRLLSLHHPVLLLPLFLLFRLLLVLPSRSSQFPLRC